MAVDFPWFLLDLAWAFPWIRGSSCSVEALNACATLDALNPCVILDALGARQVLDIEIRNLNLQGTLKNDRFSGCCLVMLFPHVLFVVVFF